MKGKTSQQNHSLNSIIPKLMSNKYTRFACKKKNEKKAALSEMSKCIFLLLPYRRLYRWTRFLKSENKDF